MTFDKVDQINIASSGLLVCLSWVTFILPVEAGLARLSVVLVPLVVLTNLLITTSNSVTKASGMNALEIWVVTCLCFVLVAFLE